MQQQEEEGGEVEWEKRMGKSVERDGVRSSYGACSHLTIFH